MARKFLSVKTKCSFPVPDKTSFRDGSRGQFAIGGFDYWQKLPDELADIVRCRVYRLAPRIDMRKVGKKTTDIEVWEGKIPFEPEDYEKTFYHMFGAGGYKCLIEEQGVGGVVCDIWFTLLDRDSYPPKVDDRTLSDGAENKDYFEWRARRGEPVGAGFAPPEKEKTEEEEFMELGTVTPAAAATAATPAAPSSMAAVLVKGMVDAVGNRVDDLKDQIKDAKEEARQAKAAPAVQQQNDTSTVKEVSSMWKEAAADAVTMVKNNSGKQHDFIEVIKAVTELMPKPPAPTDQTPMFNLLLTTIQESNKTVLALVTQQLTEVKAENTRLREERAAPAVPQPSKLDELKSFKETAELLGWSRDGGGGGGGSDKESIVKQVMDNMPLITAALQALGALAGPLIQAFMARPAASAPATAPPPSAGGLMPQMPPPPQQAPPPPQQMSPQEMAIKFIQSIEEPFLAHFFSPECDGFTFAQHIVSNGTGAMDTVQGRAQYSMIKTNFGPRDNGVFPLDMLIRSYTPIWSKVQGSGPKYKEFLDQFFSYDEAMSSPGDKAASKPS